MSQDLDDKLEAFAVNAFSAPWPKLFPLEYNVSNHPSRWQRFLSHLSEVLVNLFMSFINVWMAPTLSVMALLMLLPLIEIGLDPLVLMQLSIEMIKSYLEAPTISFLFHLSFWWMLGMSIISFITDEPHHLVSSLFLPALLSLPLVFIFGYLMFVPTMQLVAPIALLLRATKAARGYNGSGYNFVDWYKAFFKSVISDIKWGLSCLIGYPLRLVWFQVTTVAELIRGVKHLLIDAPMELVIERGEEVVNADEAPEYTHSPEGSGYGRAIEFRAQPVLPVVPSHGSETGHDETQALRYDSSPYNNLGN